MFSILGLLEPSLMFPCQDVQPPAKSDCRKSLGNLGLFRLLDEIELASILGEHLGRKYILRRK